MILYIIPIIVFLLVSLSMYLVSNNKDKNKPDFILIRNVLPAMVISLLVFIVIKYRDSRIFNPEPLMEGNYFD
uniref:Uncharacterized protein n=1 Tax=viral metagenome TaxID=1070528 RepID=A0A6C0I914_9ZZZZ